MKTKHLGLGLALALALVSLLAATPASAQLCQFACTCESSCDDPCRTGPFVQDCPECNLSTCGAEGQLCGGCPGPGPECQNNACTTSIHGTSLGNTLTGTSANECIYGNGGADTLYGEAGDDRIWGGDGNDTLFGGSGDDCLYGDAGNDSLTGDTGAADLADGGSGTDTCNCETEVNCEL